MNASRVTPFTPSMSIIALVFGITSVILFVIGFAKLHQPTGNWNVIKREVMARSAPFLSIAMVLLFVAGGLLLRELHPHLAVYMGLAFCVMTFGFSIAVLSSVLISK